MQEITRAALHEINAIFPPPQIIGHKNSKESVSVKKIEQGDEIWEIESYPIIIHVPDPIDSFQQLFFQ